ncbi:MAG: glycosyltransferase family 4 protein [Candidatus Magasanikbacteria bacterium]|nr:glycosyltransferase family 4 protein [Candidatus Magasanikbacteria bacterium]
MPKKKILYVITQGQWGGAQRYVYDLASYLALEFDITVAVGEPDGQKDLPAKLPTANIKLVQLKHLVRRISPYHDLLAVRELAQLFRLLRPDIIHLNSSKAGIIGSLAKSLAGRSLPRTTQFIYTVHGWVFNEPLGRARQWLYWWLEKYTAPAKNHFIVLSGREAQQAKQELNISPAKISVIPIGIAVPDSPLSRATARQAINKLWRFPLESGAEERTWLIAVIANLYPAKGLRYLLAALGRIQNKIQPWRLVIFGEGPERVPLSVLVQQYNLTNQVLLPGAVPDAARLLPGADVFVLPSLKEGLPYTILEAQAAGVPIISSAVGGIPEVITDRQTGLLVAPGDPRALSEALQFAHDHPEEMRCYAAATATPKEPYRLEAMVKATAALYRLPRPPRG